MKMHRPPELEVKESTDTASSASFLDVYLEFDDSGQLSTKIKVPPNSDICDLRQIRLSCTKTTYVWVRGTLVLVQDSLIRLRSHIPEGGEP
jgi:hypothetical protein